MKRILIALLAVMSISCKSQTKEVVQEEKKPNVLFIFPDQLRRYSAGYWQQDQFKNHVVGKSDPVLTPNIDKLAQEGVVFTNAVSNFPLCSPYRGMMLSGMYPENNGIWNNCRIGRNDGLKNDVRAITDLMYEAGYTTSYFGKMHYIKTEPLFDEAGNYVGSTEAPGGHYVNRYDTYVPEGPQRHSIEYFYQALKDEHFNPHIYSNDPNAIEGKKDGELHLPRMFSAKNEAEKIVSYLQNKNEVRDTSKPFFMIWSLNPPHNPWTDESTDMDALKANYDTDKFPEIDRDLVVRENADLEVANYARHYFANVTSVDTYIGQVLDELERMGELDNTIVIFSADHGEMLGSHGLEGKNYVETESVAIPFIVHWPKGLKPGITDAMFNVPDVLPTVMGLAGLEDQIPVEVQGKNFADLVQNPKSTEFEQHKGSLIMLSSARGITNKEYTLALREFKKKKDTKKYTVLENAFIYDNVNDPYQLHKIPLKEKPMVAAKLLKELGQLLKDANDPWYKEKRYGNIIPYPSN